MRLRAALCTLVVAVTACASAPSPVASPPREPAQQALTAVASIDRARASPTPTPARPPAPAVVATPGASTPIASGSAGTLPAALFDGQLVVARDDGIMLVAAGQRKQLFKADPGGSVKDPAFSPDGMMVAFAYAPPRPKVQPGRPIVEQLLYSDVMIVGADGSNLRAAARHDVPGSILEMPAWSPDGKAIYYSYYAPTYKGNELVDELLEVRKRGLDGQVEPTSAIKNASNVQLSRDGKWMAYVNEDQNEGQSLRVMPAAGGVERTLVRADRFSSVLAPRFSPDGNTIAFSAADVAPARGPGTPAAAQPRALGSLDLLRVLVVPSSAEAHGLPWEIWTVPTNGGPLKQLTRLQEDAPYAQWSSNGARILVYGAGGLYMVDVATGTSRTLTSDGSHGGMDWQSGS